MKKVVLFLLFFLSLTSSAVFAHTALESANPAEGDVVTEELQEMVLEFNTDLEQGSSFTVEDERGPIQMSKETNGYQMRNQYGKIREKHSEHSFCSRCSVELRRFENLSCR